MNTNQEETELRNEVARLETVVAELADEVARLIRLATLRRVGVAGLD